jgi:hypothetical protein
MKDHSCVKNQSNSKIILPATSLNQSKLTGLLNNYKQIQISHNDLATVKHLACSWVCQDMRSFTTIEDKGLRELFQEFINLGELVFGAISDVISLTYCVLQVRNMASLMLKVPYVVLMLYPIMFIN